MGFKSVIGQIAPFFGLIADTVCPAAAPLIKIGASLLTKGLGKNVAPTSTAITDAITAAISTPEDRDKIKQIDNEFAEQMKVFNIQSAEDMQNWLVAMENADAADRASARNREIQVRDRTPEWGFYLLIALEAAIIVALFKVPIPAENKAIVFSISGGISTLLTGAGAYFWGSNRSNQRATELLSQAPAIQK